MLLDNSKSLELKNFRESSRSWMGKRSALSTLPTYNLRACAIGINIATLVTAFPWVIESASETGKPRRRLSDRNELDLTTATRREPIHGGSAPAFMLETVAVVRPHSCLKIFGKAIPPKTLFLVASINFVHSFKY